MTDRPILFSGPMVQALLAGRKTQTRRVVPRAPNEADYEAVRGEDGIWRFIANGPDVTGYERAQVPITTGDRLWVRERLTRFDRGTCDQWVWYTAGRNDIASSRACAPITEAPRFAGSFDPNEPWPVQEGPAGGAPYSVPSIHMPRWASRLTLVVADVRVERLQAITADDALAEGIESDPDTDAFWGADGQGIGGATRRYAHPEHAYRDLWDHLNEARGFGWEANPWVVAVTFTVHRANIDTLSRRIAA